MRPPRAVPTPRPGPAGRAPGPAHRRRRRAGPRAFGVLVVVLAAAVGWLVVPSDPEHRDSASSGVLVAEHRDADGPERLAAPTPGASPSSAGRPAKGPVVRAAKLLRAWDERRAAAYAGGDVAALRGLYVGRAGRTDVRLLRSYLERGLRVEGLRMQLLAVEVLGHRRGRWTLQVTDRLAAGRAVGRGGLRALPRDRASVHLVRLVRGGDGRWRVAAVSGGGPR